MSSGASKTKKKLSKRDSKKNLFEKTISYTKKKKEKKETPTDREGQQVTFDTHLATQIPVQLPTQTPVQQAPTTTTWTRTDRRPGAQQLLPLPRPLARANVPTITTTITTPTHTPPVITTLPDTLPPDITLPDTTPIDTTPRDTTPTTTLPPSTSNISIVLPDPVADRDREKDDDTPPTITTTRTTTPKPPRTGTAKVKSRPGATRFENLAVTGDAVPLEGLADNVQGWLRLQSSVQAEHREKMRLIVDTLVGQGEGPTTLTDLAARINAIGDLYDRLARGEPVTATLDRDAQTALNLYARTEKIGQLNKLIVTDQADTVPLPQLTALVAYLEEESGLREYLRGRGIGLAFNSAVAKSQGGGVYDKPNIHLYGLESVSPDTFLRLLVHEAGHGTYQRRLIPEKFMPLDKFWDRGTAADLFDRMDALQQWAREQNVDLNTSTRASEYQELVAKFNGEKASGMWADLGDDAKLLYRAWSVLRRNDGQYLQGFNMGPGKSEPERKKYQADYFTEFCAESFMLTAKGDADTYYESIMSDTTVPVEVKGAWKTAMGILEKHAKKEVLGWT